MKTHILLVEDEKAIQSLIVLHLQKAGYEVVCVEEAEGALTYIQHKLPDLLLLDLMLPGISGLELLRRLRNQTRTMRLPIILLTARSEEEDKVVGLSDGADDYITKPFSPRELIVRIQALLRRIKPHLSEKPLCFENLILDPLGHTVFYQNVPLKLGRTEFRLLYFLMSHPDRLYSRSQLLDHIWGDHVFIGERTIDVHIRRLRIALAKAKSNHFLQTIHGLGYRFTTCSTSNA